MDPRKPSRTFGLVAGLGVGASVFYYKAVVDALLGRGYSPSLLMVHADARQVMALAGAGETRKLAEYLAGLLHQLARGGAQIAAIPAFTPQICADELSDLTPLPLINLLDVIVEEIERRRLRRVALFGSRVTMETGMFGKLGNVQVVAPKSDETTAIADIYVRIVEQAAASRDDFEQLRALAHALIQRETLDSIVFAGTDLALVFNPENADFPHLDGARVHVKAIVQALTQPAL